LSKTFICKYGLYHDKPCINGEPSSNNGWIYTAYAYRLLSVFDVLTSNVPMKEVFDGCVISKMSNYKFMLTRLPGKPYPPISRDELIGMACLSKFHGGWIPRYINKDWTWYRKDRVKTSSLFQSIKALYSIRNEHRNTVWKEEIIEGYPLAFRLMWWDRYFFNKKYKMNSTIAQYVWFKLYTLSTILTGTPSELNILWLQLKELDSKFWIKLINQKKSFGEYFSEDHPFNNN